MKVCPCGKKVVKGKIAQMPHTADAPDGASAHEAGVGFGHTSRCRENIPKKGNCAGDVWAVFCRPWPHCVKGGFENVPQDGAK